MANAVQLIKQDHKKVANLFAKFQKIGFGGVWPQMMESREKAIDELGASFMIHTGKSRANSRSKKSAKHADSVACNQVRQRDVPPARI